MSHRIEKFASMLKHCLAEVFINDLDDPQLKFISISNIEVSGDLKNARIFISSPNNDIEEIIPKLTKLKGFIKKILAKRMYAKYLPELYFFKDTAFELDQKITKLIH